MPHVCAQCGAPVHHGNMKRCHACQLAEDRQPTPNEKKIFDILCRLKCADRDILTNATGIPRTTVYDALVRLEQRQAIVPFTQTNEGPGTPKKILVLHPDYGKLTATDWRRMQQTIFNVRSFFASLADEDEIRCPLSGEVERYGAVKAFCASQCGVRIGCMEANREGEK